MSVKALSKSFISSRNDVGNTTNFQMENLNFSVLGFCDSCSEFGICCRIRSTACLQRKLLSQKKKSSHQMIYLGT